MRIPILFLVCCLFGCTLQYESPKPSVIIESKSEISELQKHLNAISENGEYPSIVQSLKRVMHNPDRFEFIRAESTLRSKLYKRSSGGHVRKYHYLIRIHYRGENAFGALRLNYQDYHLYPTGKTYLIKK